MLSELINSNSSLVSLSQGYKKQKCRNRVLWRHMDVNNFTEQTYKTKSSRSWQSNTTGERDLSDIHSNPNQQRVRQFCKEN